MPGPDAEVAMGAGLAADWHDLSRMEIESASSAAPARRSRRYGWLAGIVLLTASLGLQAAYVMRDDLAGEARWRPWLEAMCAVAGCELPLMRDVDAIRLVRGRVTEHPEIPGALVATAALVNDASFRQPYPLLQLSLLDNNQNISGERWFHPEDYLGDGAGRRDWTAGMAPGATTRVRLVLEDPGTGARQYIFDLR